MNEAVSLRFVEIGNGHYVNSKHEYFWAFSLFAQEEELQVGEMMMMES
jgi:hypothetical protein